MEKMTNDFIGRRVQRAESTMVCRAEVVARNDKKDVSAVEPIRHPLHSFVPTREVVAESRGACLFAGLP